MKIIRDENNQLKNKNTEINKINIYFNIFYIYIYLNI